MSNYTPIHTNIKVLDLERSIAFYREAFGFEQARGVDGDSFKLAFLHPPGADFELEMTWNEGRVEPYDLGENPTHLALRTPDFSAELARHRAMGIVDYENEAMGLYFVKDPDGYQIEVLPTH